jgi:hypothetical protein
MDFVYICCPSRDNSPSRRNPVGKFGLAVGDFFVDGKCPALEGDFS